MCFLCVCARIREKKYISRVGKKYKGTKEKILNVGRMRRRSVSFVAVVERAARQG